MGGRQQQQEKAGRRLTKAGEAWDLGGAEGSLKLARLSLGDRASLLSRLLSGGCAGFGELESCQGAATRSR